MRKLLVASLLVLCAAVIAAAAILLRSGHAPPALVNAIAKAQPKTTRAPASSAEEDGGEDEEDAAATARARRRAGGRAAPVWTVDKAASRLSFRGVMNGEAFDGVFRDWDAEVAFDPKNLQNSHAAVTVDTTSALTGQPIKDQALPNSEWLATATYPQATLVTRTISEVGPGRYQAVADVHIRGVSWRTTVPFSVTISHDDGRMEATLPLDRRTFGIGEGPFQSPAPVEPTVQVIMKLVAQRTR